MTRRSPDADHAHVVVVCRDRSCGLRYPAPVDHRATTTCPRCGSAARVVEPVPNPPPRPAGPPSGPRVAGLLDNVRSTANVGAMFRTADAAGLTHLHLAGITAGGDHPGLAKTALGAQEAVAWSHHPDAVVAVTELRARGWQVWALEAGPAAVPLVPVRHAPQRPGGVLVVVGNEVSGIDPAILACADRVVALPMFGTKRSLNVSTAFGIAVYSLRTPA